MKFDNIIMMVVFLGVAFLSGILAGTILYSLNIMESTLQTIDVQIPLAQNSTSSTAGHNVTTFQDVLDLTIYPLLTLKDSLITLVYFMVFAFIIALAIVAYMSSKNPIFFTLHVLFTLVMTYLAILISNAYQNLLTDSFINTMMSDFGVYNMIMLHLPSIFFTTSIVFGCIAFVNVLKPSTATHPYGMNFGGDY